MKMGKVGSFSFRIIPCFFLKAIARKKLKESKAKFMPGIRFLGLRINLILCGNYKKVFNLLAQAKYRYTAREHKMVIAD